MDMKYSSFTTTTQLNRIQMDMEIDMSKLPSTTTTPFHTIHIDMKYSSSTITTQVNRIHMYIE